MKIVCLIDSIGAGGAQRQLVGLAKLLKERGNDILLIYYHDNHFFSSFLQENRVRYKYVKCASNILKKYIGVYKIIKMFAPQVVISYLPGANMLGALVYLLNRKFHLIVSERSLTVQLNFGKKIKYFLYRCADNIVSNSYAESRFIAHRFPSLKNKLTVITNFVDTNRFAPRNNFEKDIGTTKLLCVGSIRKVKNTLRMIEAIKIVSDRGFNIQVKWFGKSLDSAYYKQCIQRVKDLGLEKSFLFYPPISAIEEEYQKADLFCIPSLYEGFPNALCEAMSCGLPVIASNVSDNPSILENNMNFLFDPYSIEDIAECIVKFIVLPQKQKIKIRMINREIAVQKFSEESFLLKYEGLIDKCLHGKK